MGRPTKTGLDYFPLDVNMDDNLELIEAEHGLPGFAIVIKLWQKIYSNGYFIEWNNDAALLFARKINSELTIINSVINSCFKRNLLDEKLNLKYGILTSSGIQKRYLTACSQSKRKSIIFISEYKLINSEYTELITELIKLNQEESTQSKVKESKVKESKVNIYADFLEKFNSNLGKKFKVIDKKTTGQINARLKEGFTIEDILKAAENCSKDKYHIENPQYLTPEFITRADKLQKYLNANQQKINTNGKDFATDEFWGTRGSNFPAT